MIKFLFLLFCIAATYAKQMTMEEMFAHLEKLHPDRWLEVPLDHFNLFDNRTWKMRYKVSEKYFEEGNPLFIEVGGEWTIDSTVFITGQLKTLAEKHKGMIIETEHRYYGKSLPFGNDFSTEKLKWLQMEQALEDLAYFIEHFKAITPGTNNSKVIIHGCSYPGMLVTWLRLRFPHLVDIAYASSAPLGVGLNYPEYYEVVNDVYANVSSQCIGTIKDGIEQTEKLMQTKEGREKVRNALSKWNCVFVDILNAKDILDMYMAILNVMHDPFHYEDVGCLILAMDTDDTEPYERLANFMTLKSKDRGICPDLGPKREKVEEQNNKQNSTKSEEASTESDEASTDEEIRNGIGWLYQTCTEMGTFTTLNRTNSRHPFATDLSVHDSVDRCVQRFGGIVTEEVLVKGIERVTRRYGGKKPTVTKVVTVQGTHDPWKHLAVLEDYTSEAPVWIFEGSHCSDVIERDDDPDELQQFRKKVRDQISKWIKEIS